MPFSEAIFLRQKKKMMMIIIIIITIVADHAARSVKDALQLMLGFAESVVLFLLCHFHLEYLPGFFVKILLQPSQQK
jgi:hypothetical protein